MDDRFFVQVDIDKIDFSKLASVHNDPLFVIEYKKMINMLLVEYTMLRTHVYITVFLRVFNGEIVLPQQLQEVYTKVYEKLLKYCLQYYKCSHHGIFRYFDGYRYEFIDPPVIPHSVIEVIQLLNDISNLYVEYYCYWIRENEIE